MTSVPFCVLATTPRSGSHLLMSSLAAQGTVLLAEYTTPYRAQLRAQGRISEALRARMLADIARADASQAKSRIGELGARPFACRGTKLFPAEVELICAQWGSLEQFFAQPQARIIRLRRRDILAQAVSQFVARQTGEWFAYVDANDPPPQLAYDGAVLRAYLDDLQAGEATLDRHLADCGDRLMTVDYEQLVRAPEQTLRELAAHCGHALDPARGVELPHLFRKQAGPINAEFAARLRRELTASKPNASDAPTGD